MNAFFQLDGNILLWIQENLRCAPLNFFFSNITHLGDKGWFWIAVTVVLLLFKKTRKMGLCCAVSMLMGLLVTNICLKNWVARIRPYEVVEGLKILIPAEHSFSFPSGHTTNSFAAGWVIYKMAPKKYGLPTLILAIIISFSRLFVGVHYPTDVLGGVVIGCGLATLAMFIVKTAGKKPAKG